MLDEKTMVSDALAGVNGELVRYGEMISQTENKELKQKLKQIRNDCEMSQEKLYQIAREKSYYVPAAKATDQEMHTLVSKMHAGTFSFVPACNILLRFFLFVYYTILFLPRVI